jgi:hypothetical protein
MDREIIWLTVNGNDDRGIFLAIVCEMCDDLLVLAPMTKRSAAIVC